MVAGRWVGRRNKDGAAAAAVAAMRAMMVTVAMDGVVVIGESEKDDAPMLYNGERVGSGTGTPCDVAVDPVDGTTLTSKGMGNAVSVLAVAPRGAMFDPSAVYYMDNRSDEEKRRADEVGLDLDAVLRTEDLVSGDDSFFVMTGITDGELLHGVRYGRDRAITESLVMRSRSGTVRQVRSTHHLDRLQRYSTVDYRHAADRHAASGDTAAG
jgi:fructose-1,6-bisphosphatase/sedoheptulose 1,7-bisphosphatase-like protein